MDNTAFNVAIKAFYLDTYNVIYLRDVKVEEAPDGDLTMYTCKMTLSQTDRPICLAGQYTSMDEFLVYVLAELKSKKFPVGMQYFKLIQTDSDKKKETQNNSL
jgi:hypothetical protein